MTHLHKQMAQQSDLGASGGTRLNGRYARELPAYRVHIRSKRKKAPLAPSRWPGEEGP